MSKRSRKVIKTGLAYVVAAGAAVSVLGVVFAGDTMLTTREPVTDGAPSLAWTSVLYSDASRFGAHVADVGYAFHGHEGCRSATSVVRTVVACPDGYEFVLTP